MYDNTRGYEEHMMTMVTNTHASRRLTSLHWHMPQAVVINTQLTCTYL